MILDPFTLDMPGIEAERASAAFAALQLAVAEGKLPEAFPIPLWVSQDSRYRYYWSWYRGDILNEIVGKTEDGRPIYRYPLRINPVRNFARKHAALLFGEVPDTPSLLIKPVVSPLSIQYGETASEAENKEASRYKAFLNKLWMDNHGNSILMENGLISQVLGGSVLQYSYHPERTDLIAPIVIRNVYPDYFLPIWQADNYWDLLEAWIVYRTPTIALVRQYGINTDPSQIPYSLWVEHWTRDRYSIYIDGEPLTVNYRNGIRIRFENRANPFNLVPFTYTPRLREGNFYGSGIVPDLDGLAIEFNARIADEGDAVRKSVHRKRYGINITQQPTEKDLDRRGNKYIDLGVQNPAIGENPEIKTEDAPEWSTGFSDHKKFLWDQIMRDGNLGATAFGEDEGSQRSGITVALRMFPTLAIARKQRVFWSEGFIHANRNILKMAATLGVKVFGEPIAQDFDKRVSVSPDWLPMMPRDSEALVSEVMQRMSTEIPTITLEQALNKFGDHPDTQQAIKDIYAMREFIAEMEAKAKPRPAPSGGAPSQ